MTDFERLLQRIQKMEHEELKKFIIETVPLLEEAERRETEEREPHGYS